ncbi:sigma-54-dependent Fis family transcriptional regulator [Candidatus Sumerlaeota bacterium]|nr:sigma-54-dependent Fis family transcriptional regulator [Candidatus Sumerlaeota bacterium]
MNASILIIDDEAKMGKALRHVLAKEGYDVDIVEDPKRGLDLLAEMPYDVVLCDLKMPGMSGLDVLGHTRSTRPDTNVIMMTAYASTETAVESMKKGAYDYLIKPFSTDELKILIRRCLESRRLELANRTLRAELRKRSLPDETVAASEAMRSLLARAAKVAESDATVLITGETGTGKEMLARVIHSSSPRSGEAFVAVNCGALTESLLESELFGHRRGAFTGAVEDRMGLFEAADKGTIFLDEVGEVSPAMQVKLLRVLQTGELQRVGEPRTARVDVRVIAATNRDLKEMLEEKRFRTDLYYRLNVVPLFVPPLRERREDVAALVERFLTRYDSTRRLRFTPEAMARIEAYDWPGNVRELENVVQHAVVLAESDSLGPEALPAALRPAEVSSGGVEAGAARLEGLTLEQAERALIEAAMTVAGNNMTQAAKRLGVTRRTLGYRLRKHGLYHKDYDVGE